MTDEELALEAELGLEINDRGSGSSRGTTYRQAHGVFVGVDYELPRAYAGVEDGPPLDAFGPVGAANDVKALSAALAPSLSTMRRLMSKTPHKRWKANHAATRENILATLEDTVQAAKRGDLIITYFSGYSTTEHGDLYLMPYDFWPGSVLKTAVSLSLATAVLSSAPGVMSLIILDTCFAAALGFEMSNYRVGSESGLMLSSGPKEGAVIGVMEDDALHGTFTWALVEALEAQRRKAEKDAKKKNRPQGVALIDWFDDAYRRTVERDDSQHPLYLGTLSPNLRLRSRRSDDPPPAEARARREAS